MTGERGGAERELFDDEELVRLALDETHAAFYLQDFVTGLHIWSRELYDLLGLVPGEFAVNAESFTRLIHPDDVPEILRTIGTLHEPGCSETSYRHTFRLRKRDDDYRWVQVRALLLRNDEGQVVREKGVVVDVSARHELESKLSAADRRDAVSNLAGIIAHDFNNLLMVILGEAELASLDGNVPERTLVALESILDAATQGGALTRRLLAFSKNQLFSPRVVDLHQVITQDATVLAHAVDERYELVLSLHEEPLMVNIDLAQMEQVLLNLVINARDAMPEGGPIVLSTGVVAGREHAWLEVTDSGVGIPGDILEAVFEPYFTTKPNGTGLGLASCRNTIERCGGTLSLASSDRGTTVHIELPSHDLAVTSAPIRSATPLDHTAKGECVLIVEDALANRELVERALGGFGFNATACATPEAALALLRDRDFHVDVLLSDVVMPGMNIAAFASAFRDLRPRTPIVFMSGHAPETVDTDIPLLTAMDERLSKPLSPVTLARTLRGVLAKRGQLTSSFG